MPTWSRGSCVHPWFAASKLLLKHVWVCAGSVGCTSLEVEGHPCCSNIHNVGAIEKMLVPKSICLVPGAFPWCSSSSSPHCLQGWYRKSIVAQENKALWSISSCNQCYDFACSRSGCLMDKLCWILSVAQTKGAPCNSFPIFPTGALGICPFLMFYVTWDQLYKRTRSFESSSFGNSEPHISYFFLLQKRIFLVQN